MSFSGASGHMSLKSTDIDSEQQVASVTGGRFSRGDRHGTEDIVLRRESRLGPFGRDGRGGSFASATNDGMIAVEDKSGSSSSESTGSDSGSLTRADGAGESTSGGGGSLLSPQPAIGEMEGSETDGDGLGRGSHLSRGGKAASEENGPVSWKDSRKTAARRAQDEHTSAKARRGGERREVKETRRKKEAGAEEVLGLSFGKKAFAKLFGK
jgi:hypothetical protein